MRTYPIKHYVIGCDLGRDRDHSAFAVVALREEDAGPYDHFNLVQPKRVVMQLGALRRIPLGTQYLDVIKELRKLVLTLRNAGGWGAPEPKVHVVIDAAGPGQVAIELIRSQYLGINLVQTLLTGGHDIGQSQSGKTTIPRRDLIANLRYLLEVKLLHIHRNLRHGAVLEREVAAVKPRGGQYEHDDLVIAAALTTYQAFNIYPELLRPQRAA
ncbi:MAG: hypothetical protein HYX27_01310 [Acidobacteria bacterium]|nr:hypothetical protein [Acidobacteriota bacterium]